MTIEIADSVTMMHDHPTQRMKVSIFAAGCKDAGTQDEKVKVQRLVGSDGHPFCTLHIEGDLHEVIIYLSEGQVRDIVRAITPLASWPL